MTRPSARPDRPLRRRDAAAAAALHARAMADAWDTTAWAGLIAAPAVIARGTGDGENLDAAVLARVAADEAEIVMLAVDPRRRRRGLARALLAEALATAATRGARRAFLEVAEDNTAAEALYRALGFVDAGRRVGYYAGPEGRRDALVLSRPLPLDRGRSGS